MLIWESKLYKKVNIQLYDKRDHFPFSIVRMLHPTSNIKSEMFYSAFTSFSTCLSASTTSNYEQFCKTSNNLISRMPSQVGDITVFKKALIKTYGSYFQIFNKFHLTLKDFLDSLIKEL